MANFPVREKYEGEWHGEHIRFNREWKKHRFTDDECKRLCAGETIRVDGLVGYKSGKKYSAMVKLERQTYKNEDGTERTFVGAYLVDFVHDDNGPPRDPNAPRGVPRVYCEHRFTDDERSMLESGQWVQVDDYVSKKTGKTFAAKTRYDKDTDRLVFEYTH